MREQHLGAAHAVLAQLRFVNLSEAHLSHRRSGLQLMNLSRPLGPAKPLHPFGNRAAGHHDDLAALRRERGHLATPVADRVGIDAAAFIRHEAGTHLDDDAPRVLQRIGHGAEALVLNISKRGSGSSGTAFFSWETCS